MVENLTRRSCIRLRSDVAAHLSRLGALALYCCAVLFVAVGSASGQVPLVRDSGGVRIVENAARATAPVSFSLGPVILDLGGPAIDTDDEFLRGVGLAGWRLSDGTVAVPDRIRVQFFDSLGERRAILARQGAGPEELSSLGPVEFCVTRGDTLVGGDVRNARFAVLHGHRVIRTVPYNNLGRAVRGCFDDGSVMLMSGQLLGSDSTYTVRLSRARLDGSLVNSLGEFTFRMPTRVTHLLFPSVGTWGQSVFMGDGTTSEVRVFRSDGELVRIIRSADRAKRITAEDVERELRNASAAFRNQWRPATYPTYERFVVGSDGRLWIKSFSPQPTDVEDWAAFDIEGRLLGRLEVSRTLRGRRVSVKAFGEGEVQLQETDNDGFQHLVFYRLTTIGR